MSLFNSPLITAFGVLILFLFAYQVIPLYFLRASKKRRRLEKEFNRYFSFLVRQEEMKLSSGSLSGLSKKKNKKSRFKNQDLDNLLSKLEWGSDSSWNKECLELAQKIKLNLNQTNFTQVTQYIIQHFINDLDQNISKKDLILFTLYLTPFYQAIIQQKKIRNNTPEGSITNEGISLHFLITSRDINFESNFTFLAQNLSQKDNQDYILNYILRKDFSYKTWSEFTRLSTALQDPFLETTTDEQLKKFFPERSKKGVQASFKKHAKTYHPDKLDIKAIPAKYHKEIKEIVSERFQKINQLKEDALAQLVE